MNNAAINNKMGDFGGPGVLVNDAKIWANRSRVKERIEEELKRRQAKIHDEEVRWADDKDAKIEEYKLGRAAGRAIHEELEDRERGSENIFMIEEESENPRILFMEDGSER